MASGLTSENEFDFFVMRSFPPKIATTTAAAIPMIRIGLVLELARRAMVFVKG
jgi:hypothetical protein